jgi:hypothetical protein
MAVERLERFERLFPVMHTVFSQHVHVSSPPHDHGTFPFPSLTLLPLSFPHPTLPEKSVTPLKSSFTVV